MTAGARGIIFAGPSLPTSCSVADATLRPPAARGDIIVAMRHQPSWIGLVDGHLLHQPSVMHKEILCAIDAGIPVIGSSSMGALRAAELASLGMIGVGRVYEWYRDGTICGDDEVAILHGPKHRDYQPRTQPIVELRATLLSLAESGRLLLDDSSRVIREVRQLPLMNRTLDYIADCISGVTSLSYETVYDILRREWVPQKQIDCHMLLQYVSSLQQRRVASLTTPLTPHSWTTWLSETSIHASPFDPSAPNDFVLLSCARLFLPEYRYLHARTVRILLAHQAHSFTPIYDPCALHQWGERNAIADEELNATLTSRRLSRSEASSWAALCEAYSYVDARDATQTNVQLRDAFGGLPEHWFAIALKMSTLFGAADTIARQVHSTDCRAPIGYAGHMQPSRDQIQQLCTDLLHQAGVPHFEQLGFPNLRTFKAAAVQVGMRLYVETPTIKGGNV